MQAASLSDIFSRHAGFPREGAARLGSEEFADRVADRIHTLGDAGLNDAEAWVDHFFDLEHPFESREKELKAAATLADRGPSVLEFELGAQEYVVVEDDEDNLVIISNQGTVVLDKRSDLAPRVRAAALPDNQQVKPGSIFRPQGEHAYFVERSGRVLSVDSKAVASLLRGVDTRIEPLARVAQATSRLAAFAPTRREASPTLRPEPVRKVAALAKADQRGTGPSVLVVEKTRVREVEGASARVWRNLAERLAARGGSSPTRAGGRAAALASGLAGVALSNRTYAVKVGGVTALVQRATPASLGDRIVANANRTAVASRVDQIVRSRMPAEQRGYWSSPQQAVRGVPAFGSAQAPQAGIAVAGPRGVASLSAASASSPMGGASFFAGARSLAVSAATGFSPESVLGAVRQARHDARSVLRSDARTDVLVVAAPGDEAPRGFAPASSSSGASSSAEYARAPATDLPRFTVRGAETVYSGPIEARDALPANTLFTLYGAIERTAALSGYRLPSLEVAVEPAQAHRPAAWYRDTDVSAVRELRFQAVPLSGGERLSAVLSMPFAQGGLNVGGDLTHALDSLVEQRLEEPSRVSARFEPAPTVSLGARPSFGRATSTTASTLAPSRKSFSVESPASGATMVESPDLEPVAAPAARTPVSPWVAWAFSNLSEARARTSGDSPTALSSGASGGGSSFSLPGLPALGASPSTPAAAANPSALAGLAPGETVVTPGSPEARAGSPAAGPAASPTRAASPASGAEGVRRQSVFLRFDPVDAPVRPLNVVEATGSFPIADTGLVRMPVALDDATFERMLVAAPTISTKAPMGTLAGEWLPAQGVAPAVSMRVKPMLLADVNAQRLPPTGAGVGGYEGVNSAADEFVVPVPLWVQMGNAAPAAGAPQASPYGPDTSSYFPGSPAAGSASVAAAQPSPSFDTRSFPSGGLLSLDAPSDTLPGGSLPRPDGAGFSVAGGRRGTDVMRGAGASSSLSGLDLEMPSFPSAAPAPKANALADLSFDLETVTSPGPAAPAAASGAAVTTIADPATPKPVAPVSSKMSVASRTKPAKPAPTTAASLDPLDLPLNMMAPAKAKAPRMRRQAGTGYLRFRWPSLARWWNTGDSAAARAAGTRLGEGGVVTGGAAERSMVEGNASAGSTVPVSSGGASMAAGAAGAMQGVGAALGPVSRAAGVGPVVSRSDGGPSGLGLQSAGAVVGTASSGVTTITAGAAPSQAADQTYVTVAGNGETRVATPASRTTTRKASSPAVDMTVVAAVQPQAPSLEAMTSKAFLKSKKEAAAKPAAAGRTDAAGLQGTIDSLAQRIYHRLQRRLKSDEERFGRY